MRFSPIIAPVICALVASIPAAQGAPDRFGVTFVPDTVARAQIEKAPAAGGIAVIDYARDTKHAVLVVRRGKPGRAEVHTFLTDVWYVIDGGGTLVTGGALVDGKATAPGEQRGRAVTGGITRHIGKGDLIDIPAGTPHWVSRIDGKDLVYLTVKIARAAQ